MDWFLYDNGLRHERGCNKRRVLLGDEQNFSKGGIKKKKNGGVIYRGGNQILLPSMLV